MSEFEPPRPLTSVSRGIFDQHAARIAAEGRWTAIDRDMLAAYAECVELYLACKEAIDREGVLVPGRNNSHELVRNAALTPLNQARDAMVKLAKAVPLVDSRAAAERAEWDKFIEEMS